MQADDCRQKLSDAVEPGATGSTVSHERVVADARRYLPFIHQILLSCKVQPEEARLDGKRCLGRLFDGFGISWRLDPT